MNLEEIKELYNLIMNQEYELATKIINNSKLNKIILISKLKKYSLTFDEETQKKFNLYYNICTYSSYNYFKTTYPILEYYIKYKKLSNISSQYGLIDKFRNLKITFPKYQKEINEIIDLILKQNYELDFIDLFDYDKSLTYEHRFYEMLTLDEKTDYLKKLNWSEKDFYYKLDLFKKKYKTKKDIEYADYLDRLFKEYLMLKTEEEKSHLVMPTLLKDLFESNCSVYEYCDKNYGYTVGQINKTIKQYYCTRANEVIKKLESLEKKDFQDKLNSIAFNIVNNKDYTIIDYYLETKLDLDDFYNRIEKRKEIALFISSNFNRAFARSHNYSSIFNKSFELNVKRIIRGKEITMEEKNMIFNFLEANNIPINKFTYKAGLKLLLDGKINNQDKIKIYKGSF